MEKIRDFRELIVWQEAHRLFLELADAVDAFPKTQAGRIVADQMLRSCGSISANIAEGFGRRQGKEYLHYLIVARGSTTETINWLMKCRDLRWLNRKRLGAMEETLQGIMKNAEQDDKPAHVRLTH